MAKAGLGLYIRPMSYRVEHRIGVAAPADVVWEILADLAGWTGWNPLYPRAEGRLLIDAKLSLDEQLRGQVRKIDAQVIDWVPNEQIHWREKGLLRSATRFLEIEKLTDDACIFSNGVLVEGPTARYASKSGKHRLRDGFTAMGEALKARAEAAYVARREPAAAPA